MRRFKKKKKLLPIFSLLLIISFFSFICFFALGNINNFFKYKTKIHDFSNLYGRNIKQIDCELKNRIASREDYLNTNLPYRMKIINKYGKLQKDLNKHMVDDADKKRVVYKGKKNILYYCVDSKLDSKPFIKTFGDFNNFCRKNNVKFDVVLPPVKHSKNSPFFLNPVPDYSQFIADDMIKNLKYYKIDYLNIADYFNKYNIHEDQTFYKTDAHWNNRAAFKGFQETMDYLKDKYQYEFPNLGATCNFKNYYEETYKRCYIGSMGKRTGEGYLGRVDDISFYFPKYKTSLTYTKYDANDNILYKKTGDFRTVFFFEDVIYSKDMYSDKYTAMMDYGSAFEHIKNNNLNTNLSVLLIKDSFAMPFSSYLSQNFDNTYLVDLRFNNSRAKIKDLISNHKVDLVIFIANPTTLYYYPEVFNLSL